MTASLKAEREKLNFNVRELSHYIYRNEERFNILQDLYKMLDEDPILKNDPSILGKGRIELFKIYAQKNLRLHEKLNVTEGPLKDIFLHLSNQLPGSLSVVMFIPYIKHLGTDKQLAKWLEPCLRMEVIGAYAQTEMGHGSDLRSLETTATFDPAKDEFIIHSPTLTSTKWWPGDLGLVGNHCVCFARLILNGEDKGIHGFIVQLRDVETHKVLPGVEVGDIGDKIGFNTKDNGYARFNNVRIPRENMLMRYAKVDKKGEYKKKGDERVGYAIMMQIRDMLGHGSWAMLSSAVTIATRFSIRRTQFQDDDGKERKVLDYQLQQDKLIPLIATTYAIHAGAHKVSEMAQENVRRIQENEDFSLMKDLHATLCGTKTFFSYQTDDGIHRARLACGGHGYSSYSGLPTLWREFSPTVTYEGDNTIMALQTARYLVSCLQKVAKKGNKLNENVAYLRNLQEILSMRKSPVKEAGDFDTLNVLALVQANAAYLVYRAGQALMNGAGDGSMKDSWDKKAGIDLVESARAHIHAYTYKAFMERIEKEIKSPELKIIMFKLCTLFGIEKILEKPIGLIECEYLSPQQLTLLRERKNQLLEELRPQAIGLVDAFAIPDSALKSAIGSYEGDMYEEMLRLARESNEFNKHDWTETFEKYIKPLRHVKRPTPKL